MDQMADIAAGSAPESATLSIDAEKLAQIPSDWADPPAGTVSKLNRGKGLVIDYVGHADVTLMLLAIDPAFEYGWVEDQHNGIMAIEETKDLYVLNGWLTLHGVTRKGVGTCEKRKQEYHKELIGDLLRNCAMRFGVATSLWSRAEAVEAAVESPPAWEPPARVAKAFDALKGLSEESKAKVRELSVTDGKKITAQAMADDEPWLIILEAIIAADAQEPAA